MHHNIAKALCLIQFLTRTTSAADSPAEDDAATNYSLPEGISVAEGDTFDYIVVGAGAAGIPAASRLALAGYVVLLVEAGGDPTPLTKIPAAAMSLLGSSVDWQYPTISNNVSCLASRGRQCRFSRGKCLGGSTSINYMLFTRGNRRDYDFNVKGWNWSDLKPYFLRYEGLQVLDKYPQSSRQFHNTKGILKIDFFANSENPWQSKIINGFENLGFPLNPDVNGVSQIGVTKVAGYVYKGERMSTARAYLSRDDVKNTLKVLKNTLCTGVIIDDNKTARGVTVLPPLALTSVRLFARKEVVLCAGTVGTPQILMLSGIGPAKHLKSLGIEVHSDLPVGQNMSDHVLPLIYSITDRNSSLLTELSSNIQYTAEYLANHKGPLASNGLTEVTVFANSLCYDTRRRRLQSRSRDDCGLPNMQMVHAYIGKGVLPLTKPMFKQGVNLDDDAVDQIAAANAEGALIVYSPAVLCPHSRGTVQLASTDPRQPPAIFANYLSDARDVNTMLRSITILEHLHETPGFRNASIVHFKFPGCPSYEKNRRGYWRCYVRYMTFAVYHATGTCSLGAVVDTALCVRGVRRLRVADASVIPHIPRGNTEAVCAAVGERVADLLQGITSTT